MTSKAILLFTFNQEKPTQTCFCSLWSLSAVHRWTTWCRNRGELNSSSRCSRKETFVLSTLKLWMLQRRTLGVLHPGLHHVCTLIFMILCSLSTSDDADRPNLSSLNLSHRNASSLHVDVVRSQNQNAEKEQQNRGRLFERASLVSWKPVLPERNSLQDNYRRKWSASIKLLAGNWQIHYWKSLRVFWAPFFAHLKKVINSFKIIFHQYIL